MSVLYDFWTFIIQLLPVLLRKPKHVQWLMACITPVKLMLNELQTFIDTTVEKSKYSAQTHVFSYFLRTKFNALYPTIVNTNNNATPDTELGTRIFNDYDLFAGTRSNNAYNVIIGSRLSGNGTPKPDFYVTLIGTPTANELIALRSYINKYKIYSTTYQITNITMNVVYYQNY